MLENLIFSFNSVAPMFVLILLGYFLKMRGVLTPEARDKLVYIVFNITLPMLILRDIAGQNLFEAMNVTIVGFTVAGVVVGFLAAWGIAAVFIKDKSFKGAFVQGAFRGNYAIMGISLIESTVHEPSPTAIIMLIFMVATYNSLSVFILTYYSGRDAHGMELASIIISSMAKNPLIISMFVAVGLSLASVPIPSLLSIPINHLAQTSLPLALLSLGASIELSGFRSRMRITAMATNLKLLVIPLVACTAAIAIGIRGEYLLIVFVATGSPTAVASYVMARQMGADALLSANIVVMTTLFSILSFTAFLFAFVTLGYL